MRNVEMLKLFVVETEISCLSFSKKWKFMGFFYCVPIELIFNFNINNVKR